ncbi:bifunctional AP-4-A phosphorylase/ADP sulfurylase [Microbotryomycetes sp. JL221]|nr:bifunctional AP-4-A phosphorylase/ADP sulfurylase [Microbotryomycetes sp. JL221]
MARSTPFSGLGPKIKSAYKSALENNHVLFTDSEVIEADENDIPARDLRRRHPLQKKPTLADSNKDSNDQRRPTESKPDPFSPPYPEGMFVTEDSVYEDEEDTIGEKFVVLLNKFCVTPRHFLIVTKDFAPQTSPLTPLELVATYSILKQLGSKEKHLAFFNCGPLSGASQPHKHLQFIPLSNGVAPFDAFIDTHKPENPKDPFQLPLPYANFTMLLAPSSDENLSLYFSSVFLPLLDLMIEHLRRLAHHDNDQRISLSSLSYNVIMTTSYIHVVPRTREEFILESGDKVSVNSLGFAGMLLVKSQETLNAVKEIGVLKVLEGVGHRPVAAGESVDEVKGGKELAGAAPPKQQD